MIYIASYLSLTKRTDSTVSEIESMEDSESASSSMEAVCVVCEVYPLKPRYQVRKNANAVAYFRGEGLEIADEDCWKICDACRKYYERGVPLGEPTPQV